MSRQAAQRPAVDRLDVLDGLRGLAIAIVLWFHVWQLTWQRADVTLFGRTFNFNVFPETGFLGVDLFFFISGFVLFWPHARHALEGRALAGLGHFFYRRFIKIVPSYYLSLLLLLIVAPPAFSGVGEWARQIAQHAAFIFNLVPDASGTINGVYWSLGVEVQFYLLFPLLAAAFARRPFLTALAMTALAIAFRVWIHQCCQSDGHRWLYQLPAYIDVFAFGMLAAWLAVFVRRRASSRARFAPLFLAGAIGALVAIVALLRSAFDIRYAPNGFDDWQVLHRSALAAGFLALAVASLYAPRFWHAVVANRALVFLSVISYNLYLYHQVIADQMLYRWHFPPSASSDARADAGWQWAFTACAFGLAIGFSALVTYAFERPLLERGFGAFVDAWNAVRRAAGVGRRRDVAQRHDTA